MLRRARPLPALLVAATFASLALTVAGCFTGREYPGPLPCSDVLDCDDGTPCTVDYCDADGACQHLLATGVTPDDGNGCTQDSCLTGAEQHTLEPAGQQCGNQFGLECSAAGTCTGCEVATQCGQENDVCRVWKCLAGACDFDPAPAGTACANDGVCDGEGRCASCQDGMQNGGETDVDCGGRCASASPELACPQGKHCDEDTDCQTSLICTGHRCCTVDGCTITG